MMQICHRYSLKWHFGNQAVKNMSFVPDKIRILDKYSLSYVLDEYMQNGRFVTKFSCNRLVRITIDIKVKENRIISDITFQPF